MLRWFRSRFRSAPPQPASRERLFCGVQPVKVFTRLLRGKPKRNVNKGETCIASSRQCFECKPSKAGCTQAMYKHLQVSRYRGFSSCCFCTIAGFPIGILVTRAGVGCNMHRPTPSDHKVRTAFRCHQAIYKHLQVGRYSGFYCRGIFTFTK